MPSLSLDFHQATERLVSSGFSEEQARALVETINQVDLQEAITKHDLLDLEHRFELKLEQLKSNFLMWLVPLLIGQIAIFAAVVKWL